jgi:hypothetical protein
MIRIKPVILEFCPDLSQRVYPDRNLPIMLVEFLRERWEIFTWLSVYWIPGYPDPAAPRPLQWPIFIDKEQEEDFSPTKKNDGEA